MKVGPVDENYYFDVVDIDRYDLILGTPFFTKHNVKLNFDNRTIIIDGVSVDPYTAVDEAEWLKSNAERRRKGMAKALGSSVSKTNKTQ